MGNRSNQQQPGQQQDALLQLLDSAKQFKNQGDTIQALAIFQTLKDEKSFKHQAYAWQQYAACLGEIGQINESLKEFQLLNKSYTEQTLIRAHNLRLAAMVSIAMSNYASAAACLDEAKAIFDEHGEFFYIGIIKQLEAAMALKQQEAELAIEKLRDGTRIAEIHRITSTTNEAVMRSQAPLVGAMS